MTDIQEFIEAPGRAEQVAEIQRRIEVEEIQYLLGHANIATTNIYARVRTPPDVLQTLGE
jgi:integrase